MNESYPLTYSVDYPDRDLDRRDLAEVQVGAEP